MAKKKKDGKKVKGNALEKFASRGTLQPNAVYYFDPPLEAHEIYQLENLLKNLKHGYIVTRPLMDDRWGEDQRLLWIQTTPSGDLDSWQNPDDELQTKKDTINWYKNERSVSKTFDAFYDGRELLNTPNVEDIFDKLYEQEDDFEWARDSIKTLPSEFAITFCRDSLNKHRRVKHGRVKPESVFRFNDLKNILMSYLSQYSGSVTPDEDWFQNAMNSSKGRIVMYFGTHDGVLQWGGWDDCEENSIDTFEFVFPVDLFINIYSGKDQQVMNFDNLTEQEGDEFDWVKDLGLPKGIDRSQLNRIMGGHSLIKLSPEDLRPGLIVRRSNGKFIYEIGERTTMDIEGNTYKGYKLLNVTTAHSYFAKDSQILKDFYIVTIDTLK